MICDKLLLMIDILYIKSLRSEKVVDIYAIRSIERITHTLVWVLYYKKILYHSSIWDFFMLGRRIYKWK